MIISKRQSPTGAKIITFTDGEIYRETSVVYTTHDPRRERKVHHLVDGMRVTEKVVEGKRQFSVLPSIHDVR